MIAVLALISTSHAKFFVNLGEDNTPSFDIDARISVKASGPLTGYSKQLQ